MFKFILTALLIFSIRAMAADADAISQASLKIINGARQNDVQKVRADKYLEVIKKVAKAEAMQKGKSVLTEENIVAIFNKYGKSAIGFNLLNGILNEYANQVSLGRAAGISTLEEVAHDYIKARMPLVSEATILAHTSEVKAILTAETNNSNTTLAKSAS